MWQMTINVIGMALFIGIYAYALSTEPPGGDGDLADGHTRVIRPHPARRPAQASAAA
jgi:hypothetical protein